MKIVSIVGARPQFIKAAPVSRALRAGAEEILLHTGQHYDDEMSAVFFDELEIPEPEINLGVGSGSHGEQTGRMLIAIEEVLVSVDPRWVLVYGDTNSTLAGALAAAKLGVPVAHVEAGLRSYRRDMPEETNRVLTDHLSTVLLCPTPASVANLAREGIRAGVELVGDVMVDALATVRTKLTFDQVARLGVAKPYFAATLHRAENVDHPENLSRALELLGGMAGSVVIPVHPRTAAAVERQGLRWPDNVQLLDPVGYVEMLSLVEHAEALLTDSGGLQKESVLLGTRCLTMRNETEWIESTETGLNTVVGLDLRAAQAALAATPPTTDVAAVYPPGASARIAALLLAE